MKIKSKIIDISGPVGLIEATLDMPAEFGTSNFNRKSFIAVNCHPHSLHGGSMSNKVTHTASRVIAGLGIPSLRFNFRGVGKSQGEYNEGIGEQQDLATAVNWMKQQYPQAKLILTGFSFGAFVSAFAAKKQEPAFLLSIAPPVKRFNFDDFVRPNCQWMVIMGDKDELVNYSDVTNWINQFEEPPNLIKMKDASHFFHGRLVELREHIEQQVIGLLESESL